MENANLIGIKNNNRYRIISMENQKYLVDFKDFRIIYFIPFWFVFIPLKAYILNDEIFDTLETREVIKIEINSWKYGFFGVGSWAVLSRIFNFNTSDLKKNSSITELSVTILFFLFLFFLRIRFQIKSKKKFLGEIDISQLEITRIKLFPAKIKPLFQYFMCYVFSSLITVLNYQLAIENKNHIFIILGSIGLLFVSILNSTALGLGEIKAKVKRKRNKESNQE